MTIHHISNGFLAAEPVTTPERAVALIADLRERTVRQLGGLAPTVYCIDATGTEPNLETATALIDETLKNPRDKLIVHGLTPESGRGFNTYLAFREQLNHRVILEWS